MRLLHYSDAYLTSLYDVPSDSKAHRGFAKPAGLWVSVEGEYDWKWWCEGENFRTGKLAKITEVILAPEANICYLKSVHAIDRFDAEYRLANAAQWDFDSIDWHKVAREFDGIIIAPYQWDRRISSFARWYYTWDCASGCIWKAHAVAELRPVL